MKTSKLILIFVVFTILLQSCSDDDVGNNNNKLPYQPDEFITTWKTNYLNGNSSYETSITLPVENSYGPYNYEVDWNNDGVFDEVNLTDGVTHDFGVAGTYTIRIRGTFPAFVFKFDNPHGRDSDKLLSVDQWGTQPWKRLSFSGCRNFNINAPDAPDLTLVTDMSYMFFQTVRFNAPIGNWNVHNVTDMSNLFSGARSFNQPIGNWDMGKVTNMHSMFNGAYSFNQPIEQWDVSHATNMNEVFRQARSFNQPLGNWNVSSVTRMYGMFIDAFSFDQPIGNWNVGEVEDMGQMFSGTSLSRKNYENLLTGWAAQPLLQHTVALHVPSTYCSDEALAARNKLVEEYEWTIHGDEFNCQ